MSFRSKSFEAAGSNRSIRKRPKRSKRLHFFVKASQQATTRNRNEEGWSFMHVDSLFVVPDATYTAQAGELAVPARRKSFAHDQGLQLGHSLHCTKRPEPLSVWQRISIIAAPARILEDIFRSLIRWQTVIHACGFVLKSKN